MVDPSSDQDDGRAGSPTAGRDRKPGLFGLIKYALLGFGISSPDERRENFRKWERYRQLREAERRYYGGKSLDEHVREEHERLERAAVAKEKRTGDSGGAG